MNPHLHTLLDFIQQSETLSDGEKNALFNSLKTVDKELEITAFKLDRTEKVKRTTAILLEETIEELEQKRKAVEAQNRELEIEGALEKVRTNAMGMREPADMLEVCKTISLQLQSLGVKEIRNVQTAIFNEQRGTYMNYEFYAKHNKNFITETTYTNNKLHNEFAQKMLQGKGEIFITHITGDEVKNWIAYQKTTNVFIDNYLETASNLSYYWFSLGPVALGISTYHPLTEYEIELFKRFLKVFELVYQRYLDIEKAEKQAREAQIEAALEKVRSHTMAMQKSEALQEVIQVVYQQLVHLNIHTEHAGFILDYKTRNDFHSWIADQFGTPSQVTIPYFDSIYYNRFNEAKKKGIDFFAITLSFEEKNKFYEELFKHVPGFPDESKKIIFSHPGFTISTILLENVALYIENFTGVPFSDEENAILMRFGKVFQQTYTRFLDLQKAEAQAREAQIQLALERVRARSLAMHHTSELQEVVNIVAQQLHHMNIDINGGVFITINDEVEKDIPLWASGGAADYVQKVTVPFLNKPVFILLRDAIKRKNNFFTEEHSYKEKIELFNHLFNSPPWNSLTQQRKQELLSREGGYTRSVVVSNHTSISITNHNGKKFSEADNEILKRFGNVFEQSYVRFLDLQKAETQARQAEQDLIEIKEARKKAEETLTELQSTQAQLIQSEKMASLGELTTGIAHEIQNPLNFVNNFSEVSSELISEMVEEVDKGNYEEVKAIAVDVKNNLDKINHHGKRAGDIVKGMLQHSRTSSGQKELTDINALADEYLRLAYHGLRAKDKDFNADFKTEPDETLPKINVIPQDIGRVLLNLVNNAFYAVDDKKKKSSGEYKPVVLLKTLKLEDHIEIKVKDNGNGIPPEILGKVFQPFFTTKPAGQGTGLGLSLSYDIVTKGHGGELIVETKAGEGSEFTVKLPLSTN